MAHRKLHVGERHKVIGAQRKLLPRFRVHACLRPWKAVQGRPTAEPVASSVLVRGCHVTIFFLE